MAQPTAYTPVHTFLSDSATLANFPGQQIDVEFNALKATTDQIRTNLARIQRDDGALANSVVTYDTLAPALQTAGLAPGNPWVSGTTYAVGNSIFQNQTLYRCVVAHTALVFANDFAAGYWLLLTAFGIFNGSGASVVGHLPTYSDTTGKNVTDSGVAIASVVSSSSSHAVTNAMSAQMAAATLKGNVTTSVADTADFTIQGLQDISTPSTTLDWLPIYNHTSGTIQKTNAQELTTGLKAANNTWTGTNTFNNSGYTLQPFVNAEIPVLTLSGSMDSATQGETVQIFDTYGANSNGTILFSKSGGGSQFTGSVSGSVLTVTAMGPGSLALAVGQIVMAPPNPGSLPYGTVISSFGTGAGGTGTYNLSNATTGGNIGSELILTNDLPTSPTATKNGQGIGFIVASGWYDNAGTPTRTNQSSVIQFNAEGDWSSTSWPSGINFVTTPTGSTAVSGAGNLLRVNISSGGALNQFQNGIGATLTDGVALKNNTAAAPGAQQQSPSLHLAGQGWKTNATAASQPVDWWLTNAPIQGAASPSTSLVVSYSINNGAVTRAVSITPGGLDIVGTGGITIGGAAPTAGHVLLSDGVKFADGQVATSNISDVTNAGSWTPSDQSGATLTFTNVSVGYTKIGNMVFVYGRFTFPATASGAAVSIGGLPVTAANQNYASSPGICNSNGTIGIQAQPAKNTTTFFLLNSVTGASITNANMSGLTLNFTFSYPAS